MAVNPLGPKIINGFAKFVGNAGSRISRATGTEEIKDVSTTSTERLHAVKGPEEVLHDIEEDNASKRLTSIGRKVLTFIGKWGTIAGFGVPIAGFAILGPFIGKILMIPGLLVGVPSLIAYFSQPKTSSTKELEVKQLLKENKRIISDPAIVDLSPEKYKAKFEEIEVQLGNMSPEQVHELLFSEHGMENLVKSFPKDKALALDQKMMDTKSALVKMVNTARAKLLI